MHRVIQNCKYSLCHMAQRHHERNIIECRNCSVCQSESRFIHDCYFHRIILCTSHNWAGCSLPSSTFRSHCSLSRNAPLRMLRRFTCYACGAVIAYFSVNLQLDIPAFFVLSGFMGCLLLVDFWRLLSLWLSSHLINSHSSVLSLICSHFHVKYFSSFQYRGRCSSLVVHTAIFRLMSCGAVYSLDFSEIILTHLPSFVGYSTSVMFHLLSTSVGLHFVSIFLVSHFSMSADDCRSDRGLRKNALRDKHASIQPFCWRRIVICGNAPRVASYTSGVSTSVSLIVSSINVRKVCQYVSLEYRRLETRRDKSER